MMAWEGIDKRKFPRVRYKCLIRITDQGKQEVFDTSTENLGAGGICVILGKEYDLFKTAELDLCISDSEDTISCKGTIVWVIRRRSQNKTDNYEFDVGIEFTEIGEKDRVKIASLVDDILCA